MIQISGLQAELSSIHLTGDGLYVAVPQRKIHFPYEYVDFFLKKNTFICPTSRKGIVPFTLTNHIHQRR
ncbi:hypothetical protein BDF21DRAFT_176510 [Thamnidium elegans]|nr:hypothetical protein BDF21DRAFT_176510 [Thamnidium elegans]